MYGLFVYVYKISSESAQNEGTHTPSSVKHALASVSHQKKLDLQTIGIVIQLAYSAAYLAS